MLKTSEAGPQLRQAGAEDSVIGVFLKKWRREGGPWRKGCRGKGALKGPLLGSKREKRVRGGDGGRSRVRARPYLPLER